MKKSSTRRKIFKILLKAILLFLTSCVYFLIIKNETKNLLEIKIGAKKPVLETKFHNVTQTSPLKRPQTHLEEIKKTEKPIESTEPSTLNPIYEYSEEINAQAEHDMKERREHIWRACERNHLKNVLEPNSREFILSHQLAWCTIFKSASTSWIYFMNILAGYDVRYLQRTVATPVNLARKRFPRPTLEELNDALENSLSFLIVREPFERLVSAYRNKLEDGRNAYYKQLGEAIVKQFREHANEKNDTYTGPSFKEFLLYIVHRYKTQKQFDEHWSPFWKFCTPCSINYTIIVKLETFQRDTNYIIRTAGLESLLIDKIPKNKIDKITNRAKSDTNTLISHYFSQIDDKLLREILEIYQIDFDLFNYDFQHYFDLTKPN